MTTTTEDRKWLLAALTPFGVPAEEVDRLLADLAAAYTGPTRFYHNLNHIRRMLETIDQLSDLVDDLPAVQLAAWFHDVIYDSHANDNEARSAAYAVARLSELELPAETIVKVERLILATTHDNGQYLPDANVRVLLDADLDGLGASHEEYDQYAAAIRQEYGWVPEETYCQRRAMLLQRFLEREQLYFTRRVFRTREAQARRNIAAEIVRLEGG